MNDPLSIVGAMPREAAFSSRIVESLRQARAKIEDLERAHNEPIAVIGLACRFPGDASTPERYWQLLHDGVDAVTAFPWERWKRRGVYHQDADVPGRIATTSGGFLQDIELFDAAFFGISRREAVSLDPQQRLWLEVAWEALESACRPPERRNPRAAGVFVGINASGYSLSLAEGGLEDIDSYFATGNTLNAAAGRLSYVFGFEGPSLAVDTACSSSLSAIHLACQSLRAGECEEAVAGGVNLVLSLESSVSLSRARVLSPEGRCKPFDRSADGMARAEGCGCVVLKRLSRALEDGDPIRAVIRGSSINQDGPSSGLTVPNRKAQEAVIRQALARAGVRPHEVDYVEAHGTGTPLGDPIEARALGAVFAEQRAFDDPLWIGSVKSNLGHTESASGVAGLIKVILAMEHEEMPASLHVSEPTPHVDWDAIPVRVVREKRRWPRGKRKRLAGVSSFGLSGTNAHLVVEEAPRPLERQEARTSGRRHVLTLSAKTPDALRRQARRHADPLREGDDLDIGDVCYSTNVGRVHFEHRLAVVVSSVGEAVAALERFAEKGETSPATGGGGLAFLFSGQGSQYPGMGRGLYESEPLFRRTFDECAEIAAPLIGRSLRDLVYPPIDSAKAAGEAAADLEQTLYAQPALFAVEVALVRLWSSWGIRPTALLGHSLGEYTAACVAGVFGREEALRLICRRARAMQELPQKGAMLAVFAPRPEVEGRLSSYDGRLTIAACNGRRNTVVSGEQEAVSALREELEAQGVESRRLRTSHAFHSHLVDPMLETLRRVASEIALHEPRIPLISNLTGEVLTSALDAEYWCRHSRAPVLFTQGLDSLWRRGVRTFLEIGPDRVLARLGRSQLGEEALWCSSLARKKAARVQALAALAALHVRGTRVDWHGFHRHSDHRRLPLPTYPFDRKAYWGRVTGAASMIDMHEPRPAREEPRDAEPESKTQVLEILRRVIAERMQEDPAEIPADAPLLELGADSIVFMEAVRDVQRIFGVELSIRQLFEQFPDLESLSRHVTSRLPEGWLPPAEPAHPPAELLALAAEPPTPSAPTPSAPIPSAPSATLAAVPDSGQQQAMPASSDLERVMAQQLRYVSEMTNQVVTRQLDFLRGRSATGAVEPPADVSAPAPQPVAAQPVAPPPSAEATAEPAAEADLAQLWRQAEPEKARLTARQQEHLDRLTERYTRRTRRSKEHEVAHRSRFADMRTAIGFRRETKEMSYPVLAQSSQGARFTDVDGNTYIDLCMGFGVDLFGHQPDFVVEALRRQIEEGIQVGPQSRQAGDVARLICEMTGMQRVTFCNSGTEAVMTALRLARAATGRTKIALFSGAYHGHSDTTLAVAGPSGGRGPAALPMAPGVQPATVAEVMVLPYGAERSLAAIRRHAGELAAVLVEPVQSRRPQLQPKEFLHELRTLTREADVPLLFDEMITGFRIHPGGAQAWFGVEADLATYGKLIGGGMPLGVVAGRSEFLDRIDGGFWSYGDDSYPQVERTFYAGTFCKHPLTMAASRAVLEELRRRGGELQQDLNRKAAYLADTINGEFEDGGLPIRVARYGSLMRFNQAGNFSYLYQPLDLDLFCYHLVEKGIYVWEGRTLFLSTEHTDEDLETLVEAARESARELVDGGFFFL